MEDKTFSEGIAFLSAVFPSLQFNSAKLKVWRNLLDDLDDAEFLGAVRHVCMETPEIYPGTNLIAKIRDRRAWWPGAPPALSLPSGSRTGAGISVAKVDCRAELVPIGDTLKQILSEWEGRNGG